MESLWMNSIKNNVFSKIDSNYECDVCIVGGGLCGLSCGYYLCKKGLKVVVIEKDLIGQKVSGHTTGKITYQHNLIYDYLINSYGEKFAKAYLNANKQAILNIKSIIDSENIDCDFEYQPNYVYTTKQDELVKINAEIQAISKLGENPEFVTDCALPFKFAGSIMTKNQAQFNCVKYMMGLAQSIVKSGSRIFCNSLCYDFDNKNNHITSFVNDFRVKSKSLIIASHYPFLKISGFYFAKMYQSTSYVLAINTHSKLFDGMYINPTQPIYSFRTANYNGKRILIVAGADHKTGFAPTYSETYGSLEKMVKKFYPNSEILYKWNTRDCISLDKIPYVGALSSSISNVYVATGFNKWGITSSNVAANILTDKILEKENKYSFVFDSLRLAPIKNRVELKNMGNQVVKSFINNRLQIPDVDATKIEFDNGGIINVDDKNIGIYKDSAGKIFAVNPTCSHLGCLLTWNNLDKTWDCPCHGSRYDFKGHNIYDPGFGDLERYNI